jgi:hypothetical protein
MDFTLNYPLTQYPENIAAEWTKGYREVKLSFKGRTVATFVNGLQYVKKDYTVIDSEIGEIKIRFSEQPYFMNVMVDDLHSPINKSHPKHKFKLMAGTFAFYIVVVVLMTLMLDTGPHHRGRGLHLEGLNFTQASTKIAIRLFAIAIGISSVGLYTGKTNSYYHSLIIIAIFGITILCVTHSLAGLLWVICYFLVSAMLLLHMPNVKLLEKHMRYNLL